ncbi:MAG: hypothetical protein HF978_15055 [Desulfobacteraceae bacterium]|nr:hypothetical protein [Desulfobacteraceae bacterium]MBC2756859.1 hypothetical protein [Desulfobacteraceae bacterium]
MQEFENYPDILKDVFEANQYENIVDSNFLNAYIPQNFPIPRIDDPRKALAANDGIRRHPAYVKSSEINQIFNYIGFIKRFNNREYAKYLPLLFQELKRFIQVIEEIIYAPSISISEDIYVELDTGLQNFFDAYHSRSCDKDSWVEEIWKNQKLFLEQIDMFLKTLRINGQVFDLKSDPLHEAIVEFCKNYFHDIRKDPPGETDINFVANCCSKAAIDNKPKTIWSGDKHITRILKALYRHSNLTKEFPQIYLRSNYLPLYFTQIFPN